MDELNVRKSYMYGRPPCVRDLHVWKSSMCGRPLCVEDLYVQKNYMCGRSICTEDLYVLKEILTRKERYKNRNNKKNTFENQMREKWQLG